MFQQQLNRICLAEQQTRATVNAFNEKRWNASMLHGYEMLYSLHAKVFQTLYDSQAEYEVVLRHVTQICLEDYKLEGRTKLGSYVELCFSVFSFIVVSKILFFNGTSGASYNETLKKTDLSFQYLYELLTKSREFGC